LNIPHILIVILCIINVVIDISYVTHDVIVILYVTLL